MRALDVLLVLIAGEPIVSVIATFYLWRIFYSDERRPRSWLLKRDAIASSAMSFCSLVFAWLGIWRITVGILPEWTGILTAVAILILGAVPAYFAWTIWRRRHP